MNKKIILVFVLAFLIRLIALNQSLWLDEAVTANVVKNLGFFQIITKFSPADFHPPLYYLFMKLWTNIFGYSEAALRFPSIIFSLLTGYFVYKIANLLVPRSPAERDEMGFFSIVFFLFNPLIVYYSQEARMYMTTTFFLTGALYYFISNIKNQISKIQIKNQILFTIFIVLSFYTFYGSIFLIAAFFVFFLYKKDYKSFIFTGVIFFISFLLISPLLFKQLANSKVALANVTNWSLVLGKANIKNLLLIPIKFSIGRISFEPKWLYYTIAGIWTTFVVYQISKIKNQNDKLKFKNIYLFLYLFIFPLFLGFVVSFFTPMLQYFRFLYLIPILAILLSYGLSQGHVLHRFGVEVAGGFIIFSLIYLLLSEFHREDWKSLVKSLPDDKPVYMIASSGDPVKYYNPEITIIPLRSDSIITTEGQEKIIVIPYTADIYGFDYQKILKERNYRLTDKKTFRGLEFDLFVLND